MNLSDVAVFVEAVARGSLAAAGRRLGIGAMAASRRLAALEGELGLRLLHRSTRALALTPEGESFLPHARAMLEEEYLARAALRQPDAGASGLLRVTSSLPFGRRMLVPLLSRFLHDNPEVRVELLMTDDIVDIVGQGVDLAIRIANLRDSSLTARRLADSPRGLYASPDYLAAHGMPRTSSDLSGHECLAITGTSHWDLRDASGRPLRERVAGRFSASSIEGVHAACRDGLGIAVLSYWLVADDLEKGRLCEIRLENAVLEPFAIWALRPGSRLVPAKVRLFTAALETHLRRVGVSAPAKSGTGAANRETHHD